MSTDLPADDETPKRRELPLKKKILFSAVASLLVLGTLELTLRVVGLPSGLLRTLSKLRIKDRATFDKTLGMWKPSFKGRVGWPAEIAYDIETNALGMRGPEVSAQKKAFRILCLGDSTTFSVYVNNSETYPRQLEKHLRKDFPKIEVLNGGHPAWSTVDELQFFKERAVKCDPDLVIHMFCDNDPSDIHPDPSQGRYQKQKRSLDKGESFTDQLRFHTGIGELITRIQLGLKVWRKKQRDFDLKVRDISKDQWKKYDSAYKELVDFCRSKSIPIVTTNFPQLAEDKDEQKRAETIVAGIAQKHGVPFIRTARQFRDAEKQGQKLYWLPIDSHANQQGNALLAKTIYEALKTSQLGPFKKSKQ